MSGFEVAGVVLAVLPLFTEALKPYGTRANAVVKAVTSLERDKGLEEFYEEVYWDTFLFSKTLEQVVPRLPGLSEERKQQIIQTKDMDNWDKAQDLTRALQHFLGADNYDAFSLAMGKVLGLLASLIKDKTVHISKGEINHQEMLQKLKNFRDARATKKTSSSFSERFKFLKAKDRPAYKRNLTKWIERLYSIVDPACQAADKQQASMSNQKPKGPSSHLRTLSKRLFSALWRCWSCDCQNPHKARFCIATCGRNGENDLGKTRITFNFLISYHQSRWCEGVVAMDHTSTGSTASHNRAELRKICDAMIPGMESGRRCMQLLVENSDTSQRIWRLNMQDSQSLYPEALPNISFQRLLTQPKPLLIERRRLALTFAYSLMQLHESPWLSGQWGEKQMHFYRTASGAPDLRRPFLNASFNDFPRGREPADSHFHPNSGILRLGILLIEIHNWKSIENYRNETDLKDGKPTSNTDMSVAKRLLERLRARGECYEIYTSAIEVCLSLQVPWVPANSRVSLDDGQTWSGMYRDIVEPLEREVAFGSSSK